MTSTRRATIGLPAFLGQVFRLFDGVLTENDVMIAIRAENPCDGQSLCWKIPLEQFKHPRHRVFIRT